MAEMPNRGFRTGRVWVRLSDTAPMQGRGAHLMHSSSAALVGIASLRLKCSEAGAKWKENRKREIEPERREEKMSTRVECV